MTKDISFYLDGVFNPEYTYPSQVKITFPVWSSVWGASRPDQLCGLLTSEPTFSSQNRWGPVLNDVTTLQDISALMSQQHVFSWIGASTQCWKGTDPLRFGIEMYLINYRRNLNLESKISNLVKLTAVGRAHGDRDPVKSVMTSIHGGYIAEPFRRNREMFEGTRSNKDVERQQKLNAQYANFVSSGEDILSSSSGDSVGTVSVKIGNGKVISNLLVSRVDVTPSIVEVYDEQRPKPLYYKVAVSFTGARALITMDVEKMY